MPIETVAVPRRPVDQSTKLVKTTHGISKRSVRADPREGYRARPGTGRLRRRLLGGRSDGAQSNSRFGAQALDGLLVEREVEDDAEARRHAFRKSGRAHGEVGRAQVRPARRRGAARERIRDEPPKPEHGPTGESRLAVRHAATDRRPRGAVPAAAASPAPSHRPDTNGRPARSPVTLLDIGPRATAACVADTPAPRRDLRMRPSSIAVVRARN